MNKEKSKSSEVLTCLFRSFVTGMRSVKAIKPKNWLEKKGLSYENLQIGFNSGQFHHRKGEKNKLAYAEVGILQPSIANVRSPELRPYSCFCPYSIVFPLRNYENDIVNFYAIRFNLSIEKSEYLNQDGLYPNFPHELTERLYLTLNVLDAATILECKILNNRDAVLALHDGVISVQHQEAIDKLSHLNEVLLFDKAKSTVTLPSIKTASVKTIVIPEYNTISDLRIKRGSQSIAKLIEHYNLNFRNTAINKDENALKEIHKGRLSFTTELGTFYVLGGISSDLSTLRATLAFEVLEFKRTYRLKMDLYERNHVISFLSSVCEFEDINSNHLDVEVSNLIIHLERYRVENLNLVSEHVQKMENPLSPQNEKKAVNFLSQPKILNRVNLLIEATGIIGESANRLLLFVIASSYKMLNPMHAIIQGNSGCGKSHLVNFISKLIPPEDVLRITRVTSKSFYHYTENDLVNKLIIIQDIDGLNEDALYAFREMQSSGCVSTSTIKKEIDGNLRAVIKQVFSSFASLATTTHHDLYTDHLSRSIVIGVDESESQTQRVIALQNSKMAGFFDEGNAYEARTLLQNCMRVLKPYEVINRYAVKISLPVKAKMQRRLNDHYLDMIKQITLLNQFRRKHDYEGRLIAELDDLKEATEIMFDSIMWKVDELDSSLRQFFDALKEYLSNKENGKYSVFGTRELRQTFNISRSQLDRYVQELKKLDYIKIS